MKKLILTMAILIGGISTIAFANKSIAVNTFQLVFNEEFKEISVEELPDAVKTAIVKQYPEATVNKAYMNSGEQYKIDLDIDEVLTVFYLDKEGKWLKEADVAK